MSKVYWSGLKKHWWLAWHVFRKKPIIYNCHFVDTGDSIIGLTFDTKNLLIVDCTFTGKSKGGIKL